MKILVADDDRTFSKLVCKQLTAAGYEAVVALDGMQALMFSRKESFAAIILDITMPGGNGLDALRILKSSSRTCLVPVIIVSATGSGDAKAKALALGAEAFFTKPVSSGQLVELLSRVAIRPVCGAPVVAELTSKALVRTVMVVDDDRILVKTVCRWLSELGYATLVAHSVADALKIMATRLVNLVILDLEMPGARGTVLIKQLKALNRTSAVRIIVLSGSAEGDEATQLLSLGADDFLQKPPECASLQRAVASQFTRTANLANSGDQVRPFEHPEPQASIHVVSRRVTA